jgi:phage terminase large subunit
MYDKIEIALQPKQMLFAGAIEKYPVTLYGGAKGGGKSVGMRRILLLRRFKSPGSHGVIFRKTYPELEGNHIRPLFEEYPLLRQFWHAGNKLLTLPNGSTLQFCHCANQNDVSLYQGREYHDLGIEEAGEWSEATIRTLQGSNRSSKAGIPARTILTANPGGLGHKWLKRLFIEKRYNERERPGDYCFIQALVDDNPALIENDPDYVHRLEAEPNEALRKAYRYGSWDIFAGQFFAEISRDVHLIPPFPIPSHWNKFGAYDFGFNHPAAIGWFAVDEDGNVYLYRELIRAGLRIDQQAEKMNLYPETKEIPFWAGHDCWVRKNVMDDKSPPTIADEFVKHEIFLKRAVIDRINGATQVRNYLAIRNKKPRFFIFDTCPITFDCISRMQHDPDRVEDVLKVDASEGDPMSGDDPYDMVRYGLMSRPAISDHLPTKYPIGSKEWGEQEEERMRAALVDQIKSEQEANLALRDPFQEYDVDLSRWKK